MRQTAPHSPPLPKADLIKLYRQALESGVGLDQFDRQVTQLIERNQGARKVEKEFDNQRRERLKKQTPLLIRAITWVLPLALLGVGLWLISSAVLPIASQLIASSSLFQAQQLNAPVPKEEVLDIMPVVLASSPHPQVAAASSEETSPKILDIDLDYTNLANWFDAQVPELVTDEQASSEYVLDIPVINLEKAKVKLGGTNLNQNLIQYPGTALPGDIGSPVIFGHSVLRQFYNPSLKNPNRYNSIFSTIMTLKTGDKIYITKDNVKFTYVVREKTEVKPQDTYILAQRTDARLLKLVTCTPEGTYLRRGVVTAQLVEGQ